MAQASYHRTNPQAMQYKSLNRRVLNPYPELTCPVCGRKHRNKRGDGKPNRYCSLSCSQAALEPSRPLVLLDTTTEPPTLGPNS